MTDTGLHYPTAALGTSIQGWRPSGWTAAVLGNATGPPNNVFAVDVYRIPKVGTSIERVTLSGYGLQSAVLGANNGRMPYSVDAVHAQVTFKVQRVSDYSSITLLLQGPTGSTYATGTVDLTGVVPNVATVRTVNFVRRDDGRALAWANLTSCQLALDLHWAAGAPASATFSLDAVGAFCSFTGPQPGVLGLLSPYAPPTNIKLRLHDRAGNLIDTLPWTGLSRSVAHNAPGVLSATIPRSLLATLPDEPYLRVVEDGVEAPDWYLLEDDGDDDADSAGTARNVTIAGRGLLALLEWAEVYPWRHSPGANLTGMEFDFPFTQQTPGMIMKTLIDRAVARGCLPQLTYTFDESYDSVGQPWPLTYSRDFTVGDTLLKVLTGMSDDGWADFEMIGFDLRLYTPDTVLAVDHPDIVLRLGQGVDSGPRKRTRKSIRSVIISNGAQGAMVEEIDAAAVTRYGRREGYEGHSGITDFGTLAAATTASLTRQTSASETLTLGLEPLETPALPRPGAYVRYDQRRTSPTAFEPMRIQTIAYDYGQRSISVELNDVWMDNDVRLSRRVQTILNGSSANERVPQAPYKDDGVAPATPGGLAIVSAPFTDNQGNVQAQVTATWIAPTLNVDGTLISDLDNYKIEWRQLDVMPGSHTMQVDHSYALMSWSPVVPNTTIEVRIAAGDRYGNYSPWSAWVSGTTGTDLTPPPQPTRPTVDNYLGLLRIQWDGKFVGNAGRPSDFANLEVHLSSVSGFVPDPTPGTGTLAGSMFVAGPVFANIPYGQTRYAVLVAVDKSGNRSVVSTEAGGTSGQVVSGDVFDGAIGSAKLADLAVTSAKINLLAVNTAQVGSIDVGRVAAGTLTAQIIMAGTLSTSASPQTTGGVQINALGIYAWNTSGVQTVGIDTSGNATLTGKYKTAQSGRRIEMGTSSSAGRIDFFAPDGSSLFVNAYTQSNGVEAIQIGALVPGAAPFWNMLNINMSPNGEYTTFRSGTLELIYDGSAVQKSGDGLTSGVGRFVVYQTSNRGLGASIQRFYLSPSGAGIVNPAGNTSTTWGTDGVMTVNFGAPGSGAQGWVSLKTFGTTGTPSGGGIQMFNSGGYGGALKYVQTAGNIEARVWDDSTWAGLAAAAFTVNSDVRAKTEIVDANLPALDLIRAARVRRYTRAGGHRPALLDADGRPVVGDDGQHVVNPRGKLIPHLPEIGLVAQEAPAEIVVGNPSSSLGINLYATVALLIAAVQQLADRIDPPEEHA